MMINIGKKHVALGITLAIVQTGLMQAMDRRGTFKHVPTGGFELPGARRSKKTPEFYIHGNTGSGVKPGNALVVAPGIVLADDPAAASSSSSMALTPFVVDRDLSPTPQQHGLSTLLPLAAGDCGTLLRAKALPGASREIGMRRGFQMVPLTPSSNGMLELVTPPQAHGASERISMLSDETQPAGIVKVDDGSIFCTLDKDKYFLIRTNGGKPVSCMCDLRTLQERKKAAAMGRPRLPQDPQAYGTNFRDFTRKYGFDGRLANCLGLVDTGSSAAPAAVAVPQGGAQALTVHVDLPIHHITGDAGKPIRVATADDGSLFCTLDKDKYFLISTTDGKPVSCICDTHTLEERKKAAAMGHPRLPQDPQSYGTNFRDFTRKYGFDERLAKCLGLTGKGDGMQSSVGAGSSAAPAATASSSQQDGDAGGSQQVDQQSGKGGDGSENVVAAAQAQQGSHTDHGTEVAQQEVKPSWFSSVRARAAGLWSNTCQQFSQLLPRRQSALDSIVVIPTSGAAASAATAQGRQVAMVPSTRTPVFVPMSLGLSGKGIDVSAGSSAVLAAAAGSSQQDGAAEVAPAMRLDPVSLAHESDTDASSDSSSPSTDYESAIGSDDDDRGYATPSGHELESGEPAVTPRPHAVDSDDEEDAAAAAVEPQGDKQGNKSFDAYKPQDSLEGSMSPLNLSGDVPAAPRAASPDSRLRAPAPTRPPHIHPVFRDDKDVNPKHDYIQPGIPAASGSSSSSAASVSLGDSPAAVYDAMHAPTPNSQAPTPVLPLAGPVVSPIALAMPVEKPDYNFPTPSPAPTPAQAPVVPAPQPSPVASPAHTPTPEPAPAPAPAPAPVVPAIVPVPLPAPVVPVPVPVPAPAPAPVPAPAIAPAPAPAAVPAVAPAPAPAPVPAPHGFHAMPRGLASLAVGGAACLLGTLAWKVLHGAPNPTPTPDAGIDPMLPPQEPDVPVVPDTAPAMPDETGIEPSFPDVVNHKGALASLRDAFVEQCKKYGPVVYNGAKAVPEAIIQAACKHPVIAASVAAGGTAVVVGALLARRYGLSYRLTQDGKPQDIAVPEHAPRVSAPKPYATWKHTEKAAFYNHAITLVERLKYAMHEVYQAILTHNATLHQEALGTVREAYGRIVALFGLTDHTDKLDPIHQAYTFTVMERMKDINLTEDLTDSYIAQQKALNAFEGRLKASLAVHAQEDHAPAAAAL